MKINRSVIKCPYCNESYYQEGFTFMTDVYYPPIYKDGVNINPDRNAVTIICHCLSCGKDFFISGNNVDGYTANK